MARYLEKNETISQSSFEIYADPLIKRVFYHLLDNAIRFGQTMTKIHGYYQRSGSGIILIIEDDGMVYRKMRKREYSSEDFIKTRDWVSFLHGRSSL